MMPHRARQCREIYRYWRGRGLSPWRAFVMVWNIWWDA